MSDNYIGNVLSLLRLLRNGDKNHSAMSYVIQWIAKEDQTHAQIMRICTYVLDQVAGARFVIVGSQLSDEAKNGLLETTDAIMNAFSIGGMQSPVHNYIPALDAAISNFAILASATGMVEFIVPQELTELIAEVERVATLFDTDDFDPIVRETAKRHMAVLLTMLNNVESLGVDAAVSAYYDLVIRLRRATTASSNAAGEKVAALWPEVERWAGRLAIIEQAVNSAGGLLAHFQAVPTLLHHAGKALGIAG